jgi:hypothetical protein
MGRIGIGLRKKKVENGKKGTELQLLFMNYDSCL